MTIAPSNKVAFGRSTMGVVRFLFVLHFCIVQKNPCTLYPPAQVLSHDVLA